MLDGDERKPNPQAQDWEELADVFSQRPDVDKAVGTSWSPFQKYAKNEAGQWLVVPAPEYAKSLIEAGWYCLPYVYPAETPTHSVAGALFYAKNYTHEAAPQVLGLGVGWYYPEPVLGCYGGFKLDSPVFAGKETCAGYSIWDAGEIF